MPSRTATSDAIRGTEHGTIRLQPGSNLFGAVAFVGGYVRRALNADIQRLLQQAIKQFLASLVIKVGDQYRNQAPVLQQSSGPLVMLRYIEKISATAQHTNDDEVRAAAAERHDDRVCRVALNFDALVRDIEDPCQHDHHR